MGEGAFGRVEGSRPASGEHQRLVGPDGDLRRVGVRGLCAIGVDEVPGDFLRVAVVGVLLKVRGGCEMTSSTVSPGQRAIGDLLHQLFVEPQLPNAFWTRRVMPRQRLLAHECLNSGPDDGRLELRDGGELRGREAVAQHRGAEQELALHRRQAIDPSRDQRVQGARHRP